MCLHCSFFSFSATRSIHVKAKNKPDQLLKDLNSFWNNVGEADCDGHREGRFSPMLRLHPKAKVMNVQNTNVDGGLANGTQGTIEKVYLLACSTLTLTSKRPIVAEQLAQSPPPWVSMLNPAQPR